ncbi:hypothetical protein [Tessaracoccus sp. Z1128]
MSGRTAGWAAPLKNSAGAPSSTSPPPAWLPDRTEVLRRRASSALSPAIAEAEPDVVVTFGGTSDGDYSLADPATKYFDALRQALPDAELVAISPVTTEGSVPYFLTLHGRTIRAAVEAVDGTFVNVGQPGAGDGETLSGEAQAEIAQKVVDQLQ